MSGKRRWRPGKPTKPGRYLWRRSSAPSVPQIRFEVFNGVGGDLCYWWFGTPYQGPNNLNGLRSDGQWAVDDAPQPPAEMTLI